jgi:hypothetical protein
MYSWKWWGDLTPTGGLLQSMHASRCLLRSQQRCICQRQGGDVKMFFGLGARVDSVKD